MTGARFALTGFTGGAGCVLPADVRKFARAFVNAAVRGAGGTGVLNTAGRGGVGGTGTRATGRSRAGSNLTGIAVVFLSLAARARLASRKKWSGKLYDWSGISDIF